MVAVVAVSRFGPDTYKVSPSGFVDGGMVVEPDPANPGFIRAASAASSTFLGVALQPAEGTAFVNPTTAGYGAPILDISVPIETVAVAWQGVYKLTALVALNFGQLVTCAANGQVSPYEVVAGAGRSSSADGATTGPKANVVDGVLNAGSTTVTSATAAFVAADIGRTVDDVGGAAIPANTTIVSITSGTAAVMSNPATLSGAAITLAFGNQFIVTSATAAFVNADEGSTITGGSIPALTIIAQVINGTTALLSKSPTATAAGVTFVIGAQAAQTRADQIVGRCVEPSGVLAGSIGRIRLAGI